MFESLDTSIVQSQKKGVMDQVIYGVVMFCSICLLGLIMLFVYKKRHSFKDIIITKTAVAKSNSYKSNVGCKLEIFLCFTYTCFIKKQKELRILNSLKTHIIMKKIIWNKNPLPKIKLCKCIWISMSNKISMQLHCLN